MNDLRAAIGDWSAARGDEVAASLREHTGAARVAVKRRRARNRTLSVGAAVVGLVSASALLVAGPWRGLEHAATTTGAAPDLGALTCGTPWSLAEGTIAHDSAGLEGFGGVTGEWMKATDGGDVIANPDSVWAGYESLGWASETALDDNVSMQAALVATQDGIIVGSNAPLAFPEITSNNDVLTLHAPYPGTCGGTTVVRDSGKYTYHLVITVARVDEPHRAAQTIVDPSGPITVEFTSLEQWGEGFASAAPAQLNEPAGDRYQAFLVSEEPGGSCRPLQDLHAHGTPVAKDMMYDVVLPGVQSLSNGLWARDPVVVAENSLADAWYAQHAAWLVADDAGTMPEPSLTWSADARVLADTGAGELPPNALDCVFTDRLDAVEGAVFLVIDGADWVRLGELNPGADFAMDPNARTWVYLGQADPAPGITRMP